MSKAKVLLYNKYDGWLIRLVVGGHVLYPSNRVHNTKFFAARRAKKISNSFDPPLEIEVVND